MKVLPLFVKFRLGANGAHDYVLLQRQNLNAHHLVGDREWYGKFEKCFVNSRTSSIRTTHHINNAWGV